MLSVFIRFLSNFQNLSVFKNSKSKSYIRSKYYNCTSTLLPYNQNYVLYYFYSHTFFRRNNNEIWRYGVMAKFHQMSLKLRKIIKYKLYFLINLRSCELQSRRQMQPAGRSQPLLGNLAAILRKQGQISFIIYLCLLRHKLLAKITRKDHLSPYRICEDTAK